MNTLDDIGNALDAAVEARRAYEDDPNADTLEFYMIQRGGFRTELIHYIQGLQLEHAHEYVAAAAKASDAYEKMFVLEKWLKGNGQYSPIAEGFFGEVKLPSPAKGVKRDICGHAAAEMPKGVAACLTETAIAVFEDSFSFYEKERWDDAAARRLGVEPRR